MLISDWINQNKVYAKHDGLWGYHIPVDKLRKLLEGKVITPREATEEMIVLNAVCMDDASCRNNWCAATCDMCKEACKDMYEGMIEEEV